MPLSPGEKQARLLRVYDSHPFESNLSTLHRLDRDAAFNSQPPRWAGTWRDRTTNHSKSQDRLEILNGIAHVLAKSADPTKSPIAVSSFLSGAVTTRECPHTTVVYCKSSPCSPELKRYIARVLRRLRAEQRRPVSNCGEGGKWKLSFCILMGEVVPWCWKRIYALAGELKVALDDLKQGYPPPWGDNLDSFFLGQRKAAQLKAKARGMDDEDETPRELVEGLEKELLKVLELSPPTGKHDNRKERRDYFWKHRRPIYLLLRCCDDLNDLVKSSVDSGLIPRSRPDQRKLWEVMERITALATYPAMTIRLSYYATRPNGRKYVDFSKVEIVEASPVPPPHHRVRVPSDPAWVVNELHARQPQGKRPGDPYTDSEIQYTVGNVYTPQPPRSQWIPQPKTKDVESIMCRQHPEVTIAREMLKFYSPAGRPNFGMWIFIGTSNHSCVMCRRYLDLLEQEYLHPLPPHALQPAPQRQRVRFVLSAYRQRPLAWQMPAGASEVIVEKMTLGLEKDLGAIVQKLRSYWGYRKRKPKQRPKAVEGSDGDEDLEVPGARLGSKSRFRQCRVRPFRKWGMEGELGMIDEGQVIEGVDGQAGIEKADERQEIETVGAQAEVQKADEGGEIEKPALGEATTIEKQESEHGGDNKSDNLKPDSGGD